MRYKVGDKVLIKSLDWYNENRDKIGQVDCGGICFVPPMVSFCGQIVTISSVLPMLEVYHIKEDDGEFNWTDEMIERLAERDGKTYPYKIGDRVVLEENNKCATITDLKYNSSGKLSYYIKIDNDKGIIVDYPTDLLLPYDKLVEEEISLNKSEQITDFEYEGLVYTLPDGYQFVDENGNVINAQKIALEKKGKRYPKTYEECCKVLDWNHRDYDRVGYESELLCKFQVLLLCRDAYWKIAGEEMGLGKPWEPTMETVYCISRNDNVIKCSYRGGKSNILEFPTTEMRDAFYDNFKNLIEICKELL